MLVSARIYFAMLLACSFLAESLSLTLQQRPEGKKVPQWRFHNGVWREKVPQWRKKVPQHKELKAQIAELEQQLHKRDHEEALFSEDTTHHESPECFKDIFLKAEDATDEFHGRVSLACHYFAANPGVSRFVRVLSAADRKWFMNSTADPTAFYQVTEHQLDGLDATAEFEGSVTKASEHFDRNARLGIFTTGIVKVFSANQRKWYFNIDGTSFIEL